MQRIRNFADDFFEQQGLKLPLDLEQLKKTIRNMGCKVYAYSEAKELIEYLKSHGHPDILDNDGFTYKLPDSDNPPIIAYRDELSTMKKIGVISHEIGHIVPGHTYRNGILGKNESNEIEDEQEKEADEFALEFQAPIPILRKMNLTSVDEIEEKGILTRSDARKQLTHMRKQTFIKNKNLLIITVLAVVLCCSIIWNLIPDNGDLYNGATTEPTTYIRKIGNGGAVNLNALSDEIKAKTVCVTHSGEKYHNPDCQYVKYKTNVTELELSDAVEKGYMACSVCRPDLK